MSEPLVKQIIQRHFGEPLQSLTPQHKGSTNAVYKVELRQQTVIVRIGLHNQFLQGSSINIPRFQALGIPVPHILEEDFSRKFIPYPYQVLSYLPGQDLGQIIDQLSENQIKKLAQTIAQMMQAIATLPGPGQFGTVRVPPTPLYPSWTAVIRGRITKAIEKGPNLSENLTQILLQAFEHYLPSLNQVPSICFYEDMGAKNLLVADGAFSGLVDLDSISFGDPLDAVGITYATWPEPGPGTYYRKALENALELTKQERQRVAFYAAAHRFFWLSHTKAPNPEEELLIRQLLEI